MTSGMIKIKFWWVALMQLFTLTTFAQAKDNAELQKMYDEDQSSRSPLNINWSILCKQDSLREIRVYELIKEEKIITGKDYYNSAMIFQHGRDTVASGMAVKHMKMAIELDSTVNKWLLAAAIDRDLMRRGKPQIYGTQYMKMGQNAKWERYNIDTTQVTDAERKYYKVETLSEQRIKEHNMNLLSLSSYYSKPNSIDKTIQLIKSEIKKGNQSEYNVSESGINNFGYELLHLNKNEESLKIFKLNTKLYPKAYNTFDSYGECLLKLNRKKEGLKAYKKSLALNPNNYSAIKILKDNK
jgi:tetratricopeptide (TPR) repeat protein